MIPSYKSVRELYKSPSVQVGTGHRFIPVYKPAGELSPYHKVLHKDRDNKGKLEVIVEVKFRR